MDKQAAIRRLHFAAPMVLAVLAGCHPSTSPEVLMVEQAKLRKIDQIIVAVQKDCSYRIKIMDEQLSMLAATPASDPGSQKKLDDQRALVLQKKSKLAADMATAMSDLEKRRAEQQQKVDDAQQ